jgi:hypothetical protein
VEHARGTRENPLTADEVRDKYARLTAPVVPRAAVGGHPGGGRRIDRAPGLARLAGLLRQKVGESGRATEPPWRGRWLWPYSWPHDERQGGAPMGAAATELDFEPFHRELTTASGISLREQVKWADFRDDARRQGPRPRSLPRLAAPRRGVRRFKSSCCCGGPDAGGAMAGRPAPHPAGNPSFEVDRRRFDALASFYGNRYRGSVVINYLLGALAVLFALGRRRFPHHEGLDVPARARALSASA